MEPKKLISASPKFCQLAGIILIVWGIQGQSFSQKIWELRTGNIRSQGNLGAGFLSAQKPVAAYLNGEMELFVDNRFAYTGSICYSFKTIRKNQLGITDNHGLFAGANYHFMKPARFDPYIGLIPGISLVRVRFNGEERVESTPLSVVPVMSAQLGFNFYVGSIFNFFAKVQGIKGQFFSILPKPKNIDEIRIMAGLGWNLRIWTPKHTSYW